MLKKLLAVFFIALVIMPFAISVTRADENADKRAELERKIAEYEKQLSELHTKADTLTNQIAQFNAQINLTELKIEQTQDQIDLLGERITQLGSSLETLQKAYTSRVIETYKMARLGNSPFLVITSGELTNAISRYEYLKLAQGSDQGLLARLSKAQTGYQNQKQDQETLNQTLSKQKKTLDSQKAARAQLLSVTRDNEKKYQDLLAQAKAQLAAFKSFTKGSTVLNNQTVCDSWGCYYNQRDSAWAFQTIGQSPEVLKDVGCLITSMAMVASHYGKNIKPNEIAQSSVPFLGSTAFMVQGSWNVNGVSMSRTRIGNSTGAIDNEINSGRPVIVGIYGGPDHFLVIKKKENGNYIMNDPFVANGHDVKFTDHYPLSAISAVDRVTVN